MDVEAVQGNGPGNGGAVAATENSGPLSAAEPHAENSSGLDSTAGENTGAKGAQRRAYRCQRWPFLAIGDLVNFKHGMFVATTEKQIELIEGSSDFGVAVFRVDP